MKQDIFNLCLWLTNILIIIIVVIILVNKINKSISKNNISHKEVTANNLIYNCNKNNLPQLCGNTKLSEPFEPYDGSYTNGFSINNVLCSNFDVSKSLNTTANMTFYNTTETNPNKTDKNKTITISKDGNISGVNKLINDNITFSNNATITKDLNITGKDNIKINGTEIFKLIYPVGSIYISVNSTNPATLFGGTWEQIKDRFLYTASSDSKSTGGASTVTLDIKNIPSHNHIFSGDLIEGDLKNAKDAGWIRKDSGYVNGCFKLYKSYAYPWTLTHVTGFGGAYDFKFEATPSGTISYTGGEYDSRTNKTTTKSFSIMPPYYKVYCWRRTG